ncbi:lipocalin family protein [Pedobacter nanyangensis]|uniref:lipocalin family protein n=1 Tax=Pedobacter nanyangensis TaxID=1562389 RepID=UPI000DE2F5E5|nr:lipocalin family protein [Pedobacter nanyangensis]
MKNSLILMLTLASIIALTACKKDKFADKPTQEKILGRWKFVSLTTEITMPPAPVQTNTEHGSEGDYFDFRTDGKLYWHIGGQEESYSYSIANENMLIIDGESYTIKELTEQKLVIEFVSTTATRKQIYTLSR